MLTACAGVDKFEPEDLTDDQWELAERTMELIQRTRPVVEEVARNWESSGGFQADAKSESKNAMEDLVRTYEILEDIYERKAIYQVANRDRIESDIRYEMAGIFDHEANGDHIIGVIPEVFNYEGYPSAGLLMHEGAHVFGGHSSRISEMRREAEAGSLDFEGRDAQDEYVQEIKRSPDFAEQISALFMGVDVLQVVRGECLAIAREAARAYAAGEDTGIFTNHEMYQDSNNTKLRESIYGIWDSTRLSDQWKMEALGVDGELYKDLLEKEGIFQEIEVEVRAEFAREYQEARNELQQERKAEQKSEGRQAENRRMREGGGPRPR